MLGLGRNVLRVKAFSHREVVNQLLLLGRRILMRLQQKLLGTSLHSVFAHKENERLHYSYLNSELLTFRTLSGTLLQKIIAAILLILQHLCELFRRDGNALSSEPLVQLGDRLGGDA